MPAQQRNPTAGRLSPRTSVDLDAIRGGAAFLVLIYHVRYVFFFDFGDLAEPTVADRLFYAATAFGHDAVMAFFVLSGYFVARSILQKIGEARWSWLDYSVDRLTRLYIVLVPALVLTWLLDGIGLAVNPEHFIYSGGSRHWAHDAFSVADRLGLEPFLGNLAFRQSITVPPFGSNVALWSLSFEFWYYAAFPCIAVILFSSSASVWGRLVALAGLLVTVGLMSRTIQAYAFIWLLGAAVAYVEQRTTIALPRGVAVAGARASALAVAVVVVGLHLPPVYRPIDALVADWPSFGLLFGNATLLKDSLIGIVVAVWIFFLTARPSTDAVWGPYRTLASRLSSFSYTLYLVHLPILVFARSWTPERPWALDGGTLAAAIALTALCLAVAFAAARMTEYRTGEVRRAVRGFLARRLPSASTGRPAAEAAVADHAAGRGAKPSD